MEHKFIPDREEVNLSEILEDPLITNFLYSFQQNFMKYVADSLRIGQEILPFMNLQPLIQEELEKKLSPENKIHFPNFNRYVGELERACHAAQELEGTYDLGVGIAKKGTWLSYVFHLHGFPTKEMYVIRTGECERFMHPLSKLETKDIKDKRILLFENDLVSGNSVKAVSEEFLKRGAKQIDLLLVYKYTRQKVKDYEIVRKRFIDEPIIIGMTPSDEFVIDPTPNVPTSITATMSLEEDFQPQTRYRDNLLKRLRVDHE